MLKNWASFIREYIFGSRQLFSQWMEIKNLCIFLSWDNYIWNLWIGRINIQFFHFMHKNYLTLDILESYKCMQIKSYRYWWLLFFYKFVSKKRKRKYIETRQQLLSKRSEYAKNELLYFQSSMPNFVSIKFGVHRRKQYYKSYFANKSVWFFQQYCAR